MGLRNWVLAIPAIVFLASCNSASTTSPKSEGAQLYAKNCVVCHGYNGDKGASGAPNLSKSSFNHQEIANIITSGQGIMPGFKNRLTRPQIDSVAHFVTTLNAQ